MKIKKTIKSIIAICCLIVFFSSTVQAASFDDINKSEVFLKQNTNYTCTLTSATMMVRRAAMASGNTNWRSITESAMRGTAWLEGSGLYYNFTYAGISVKHDALNGGSGNIAQLISLLSVHPEGIVIYDHNIPHAILITDYTDGVFYCADPANNIASGRIPVSSASVSVTNADSYWYVSSPKVSITSEKLSVSYDMESIADISNSNATISTWVNNSGKITEMGYYLGTSAETMTKIVMSTTPVEWTRFHLNYNLNDSYGELSPGQNYVYSFYVVNNGREYRSENRNFTTSGSGLIMYDTYSITDIADTSATIGGWFSNSSGTKISSLGFIYGERLETGGVVNTSQKIEVESGIAWTRSHQLYDTAKYCSLRAATKYYVRFYAITGEDTYYSDYLLFDTLAPQISFDSEEVSDITHGNATVSSWFSNEQMKTISSMGFYLAKENETSKQYEVTQNVSWTRAHLIYSISDYAPTLKSGTTYRVQFYIVANGALYKSNEITFTTKQAVHKHDYTSQITKEPTCTSAGIKTFTCSCEDTYTESIPATGHNYSNGSCTNCGEADPDYRPPVSEDIPQIIVESKSASAGDFVDVTIALKNNPGIASMKLKVAFDSMLTLENISYNSSIGGQSQQPQSMTSPVTLNWYNGSADSEGDWTFTTLTFKVSEGAEADETANVTVTYNADDIYDISETNINFEVQNGTITISDYLPGDINGDGAVNNKDLTRLFQYLSDWDVEVVNEALDVNGDGSINNKDQTRLFQYLSDWDVVIY